MGIFSNKSNDRSNMSIQSLSHSECVCMCVMCAVFHACVFDCLVFLFVIVVMTAAVELELRRFVWCAMCNLILQRVTHCWQSSVCSTSVCLFVVLKSHAYIILLSLQCPFEVVTLAAIVSWHVKSKQSRLQTIFLVFVFKCANDLMFTVPFMTLVAQQEDNVLDCYPF